MLRSKAKCFEAVYSSTQAPWARKGFRKRRKGKAADFSDFTKLPTGRSIANALEQGWE
jgi:hypothetical protein